MPVKPMSAYPREFHTLWDLAVQGKLDIPFDSKGSAVSFRSRMYAFRKRMMEEAPAMAEPLKEVDISKPVQLPDLTWRLRAVILPWKQYARDHAGEVTLIAPALAALPDLPTPPVAPLPDAMDNTLKHLGFGIDLDE